MAAIPKRIKFNDYWPDNPSKTVTNEEQYNYAQGIFDGMKIAIDILEEMEKE